MITWKHDVAVAIRVLPQNKAFAGFAVITMALGIGANTAIFSAVYGVLLRPLGIEDPPSLAVVRLHRQGNEEDVSGVYGDYLRDLTDRLESSSAVERLTSYVYESITLTRDGEVDEIDTALMVAGNFFEVMGVEPILGRTFLPEDVLPNRRGTVCVISETLWRGRFGSDANIVGSTLILDDESVNVVGVMPAHLPLPDTDVQIWMPQSWDPDDPTLRGRILSLARLRADADLHEAGAIFAAAARDLANVHPRFEDYTIALQSFRETLVGDARPPLMLSTVAVGLILLIACANTANLLLARAAVRAREMATRRALGARRSHVISQLIAESLTLATPGGVLGALMAFGLHRSLLAVAPSYMPRIHDVRLDLPILAFAAVLSILAGILFSLAPIVHTFSVDLIRQMSGGSGSGGGVGQRPPRLSRVLVVLQLALAVSLLVGALLMAKSLWNLQSVDPGFRIAGLGAARIYLDDKEYGDDGAEERYFRTLLERLRARGDIESAGASSGLPMDPITIDYDLPYTLPGEERARSEVRQSFFRTITPGYIETMGIPLLAGRTLDQYDRADTQPVALVNATFARLAWPDRNPVGERFLIYDGRRELLVVGVVGDVHFSGPAATYKPEFFLPHPQAAYSAMTVVTRSADAASGARAIAEEALALNRRQPVSGHFTLEALAAAAISTDRFLTRLLIAFAGVALVLSAVGIYGVVSYWVNRSRRELGVRMAFGASRGHVLRLVMGRALSLSALGVFLGLLASFVLTRFLARFLFGVGTIDAGTLVSVVLCLGATAVIACLIPGLRAARLDPMSSLRVE